MAWALDERCSTPEQMHELRLLRRVGLEANVLQVGLSSLAVGS